MDLPGDSTRSLSIPLSEFLPAAAARKCSRCGCGLVALRTPNGHVELTIDRQTLIGVDLDLEQIAMTASARCTECGEVHPLDHTPDPL